MQSPAPRPHSFQAKAKPRARVLLMESRRAEALQRQQSGRQSKVQTVRDILESAWAQEEEAAAPAATITAAESTFAAAAAAASSAAAPAAPSGFRAESAYHRSLRAHWAHQLMMPEPMESLPSDASARWMLLSRPEGLRCLVVSRRGRTLSRKKNGSVLHPKFLSSLPHGGATAVSSASGAGASQPVAVAGASASEDAAPSTILDCVWNDSARCYVILDALVWNNHHLADTEAEFRWFWIGQKMREMGATVTTVQSGASGESTLPQASGQGGESTLRFLTLPASPPHVPYAFHLLEPLSPLQLLSVYPHDLRLARLGARQDGYLFLHRATHYVFGLSQLSLQWKDRSCSPYLIEDASGGNGVTAAAPAAPGKQMVTLRLGNGRALLTEDEETVGTLDELVYQTSSMRPGDLLLFSIDGIDESPELQQPHAASPSDAASPSACAAAAAAGDMADESKSASSDATAAAEESSSVSLVNLVFVKKASAARMQADSLSKILFQFHARHDKLLTIQQIAQQLQQQQQMPASQPPPHQHPQSSPAPAAATAARSSFAASSPSPSPTFAVSSAALKPDAEGDTQMS